MAAKDVEETEDLADLAELIQNSLERTLNLVRRAQIATCALAGQGDDRAAAAAPDVNEGYGLLWQSHAALTRAQAHLPDVTVKFGGGK